MIFLVCILCVCTLSVRWTLQHPVQLLFAPPYVLECLENKNLPSQTLSQLWIGMRLSYESWEEASWWCLFPFLPHTARKYKFWETAAATKEAEGGWFLSDVTDPPRQLWTAYMQNSCPEDKYTPNHFSLCWALRYTNKTWPDTISILQRRML